MDAVRQIFSVLIPVVVLLFTALFPVAAFARGKWGAKSRVDLIGAGLDAMVVLIIGRFILPWGDFTEWAWFIPVAIVAAGAAGLVLRWRSLPVWRPDRPRWRGVAVLAVRIALVALVLGFMLWP